ncbi:unnamed protein product [Larinioides sclopetarius]|uniref:RNA-directed DNA polymerase n=1 Tax=Larinioides sclopetarius TaxID=280406 RepID=A0AAV2AC84_9ARAC
MTKELAMRMGLSNISFESYDASVGDWSSYVERLESYFVVNGIEDKMKVPAILSLMGATTYKLLKNLATPNIPSELTYQDIVKLLSEHLNPKPLEMTERFRFYKRKQFEGESIANYCAELQKLSIHCNFGNNLSTMLRDKLVKGLKNENIQKKLLAEDKLTYEKAKSIAFAMESDQRDVCEIQNQMVSIKKLHSSQDKTIKKDFSKFKKSEPTKKFDKSRKCYRCDSTQHLAHECKHKNTQCRNCLKNGHLAKVCRSKRNETVKQIESCSETVPVNSVKSPRHARDKILLEIFVDGNKCLFELDTGAAISCMNVNEFKKLCPDVAIKPTKLLLRNFDNSTITSAGQAVVQIQYKDQINTETIYLVHAKVNTVFGREWLRNFQLDWSSIKAVRVENCNSRTNKLNILLQKYEKIFSPGIRKLGKFCCRLQMKPNYKPVFLKPRPVPFALKERIETELNRDCEYLTEADVTNISQVELMPVTATDIARATKTDRKLFELYESLKSLSGTELPVPWKGRESEFSLQNGCIMYGHRVCIPEKYQSQVLEELHVGHPGIVKMKAIARSYCYWEGIDASIANFVQNCSACIATRNEPAKINRHP